jgi:hypothetical protein
MRAEEVNWPWPPPRPGDIASLALLAAVLVALVLLVGLVGMPIQLHSNWGFGRDWHCIYAGQADPVCVKDVSKH